MRYEQIGNASSEHPTLERPSYREIYGSDPLPSGAVRIKDPSSGDPLNRRHLRVTSSNVLLQDLSYLDEKQYP